MYPTGCWANRSIKNHPSSHYSWRTRYRKNANRGKNSNELYSSVEQYQALSEHQCKVPLQSRQIIYALYCDYKAVCERGENYSLWVNPFQCDGQYGLVIADEAHTLSGATLSSLYKIAKDGRFVALVGDHQNLSAHPSLYDNGSTAADLLSIKIHADTTQNGIRVYTHTLTNTHRNSEKVVNVVNFFVDTKNRIGLKTVFKGADFSLNGNNGEVGEAQIFSPEDRLKLEEKFVGKPDVVILVPESQLAEARTRWTNNTVFSPMGALGLEFPYVVCEGLLTAQQGSLKVGKLLKNAPVETPTEGHLSKQAIPPEVSEQAPWFSNLITACSRARTGVYFIEEKKSRHPTEAALFEGLQRLCDIPKGNAKLQPEPSATPTSSTLYSQWLAVALKMLQQNTDEMDTEAKRVIDANIPDKSCDTYKQFLIAYHQNQQQRIRDVKITAPSELSSTAVNITNTTPKPTESRATSNAKAPAALPKKTTTPPANQKTTHLKPQSTINNSVAPKALTGAESHAESLFIDFNETNLLSAIEKCDIKELLECTKTVDKKEKKLIDLLRESEVNQKLFARCCFNSLSMVSESKLPNWLEKKHDKKLNQLLQHLKNVSQFSPTNRPIALLLADAVKQNNLIILKAAHWAGIDLKTIPVGKDCFLIHLAAECGMRNILDYLSEIGADLNQGDKNGVTPAAYAANKGQLTTLKSLHRAGADLNQTNHSGFTPTHMAAQRGHVNILKYLHENTHVDLNQQSESGFTPSQMAINKGHIDILRYLDKAGINLSYANKHGVTLAHTAVSKGQIDVLKYLHQEVHVNLDKEDEEGFRPAYLAAKENNLCILKYLHEVAKVDITQANLEGITLAHIAARNGHQTILEYLHKTDADLLNRKSKLGFASIHLAAEYGHLCSLQYLHKTTLTDINNPDSQGYTLVNHAIKGKQLNILKYLHKEGADFTKGNEEGFTPAHMAAQFGCLDILQYLHEEIGVDLNIRC